MRALHEYFVGGIKTNLSLFRRILNDEDFKAGRLDTGFLDRLLARPVEASGTDEKAAEVAAIAAGLFAQLEPEVETQNNGAAAAPDQSVWKSVGRSEALH